jgi:AcrR family transcriptional regulator
MSRKINMLKEKNVGKSAVRRAAVRFGRPPKKLAGKVEERILGAARKIFLERGFEGASIDEIAEVARSGKPTIYARFANKRGLFTAVVTQTVAANIARFEGYTPIGATIEERLESVAIAILEWILLSDSIGLMRVAIAEALRFPDLANSLYTMARGRGAQVVAKLLAEEAQSDDLGTLSAFAPTHVTTTTKLFQDLVILPVAMRALFGENLEQLRSEIHPHVARSVAFFLAACRNGGVT